MKADLHSHTSCSDGVLTPNELIMAAADAGVELLSITDHDTLAAYRQITTEIPSGMRLLTGIELSCTWRRMTIHVVGLKVEQDSLSIQKAEAQQAEARSERFLKILRKLEKAGLQIEIDKLVELGGACPGRPHIARYLVDTGQVKSEVQAFDRYLGQGKMGDVKECWPELSEVVQWILDAGGVAVLAHPLKYRLTRTKLIDLCSHFKDCGGRALEVVSGQQDPQQSKNIASICAKLELMASVGSDFHRPSQPWAQLGKTAALPANLTPVWTVF